MIDSLPLLTCQQPSSRTVEPVLAPVASGGYLVYRLGHEMRPLDW